MAPKKLLGILPALLLPAAAPAQDGTPPPDRPAFLHLGLSAFGSAATYRMRDFNDTLAELTLVARERWGAPEIRFDRITDGIGFGAGLQVILRDRFLLAADFERLGASTQLGGRLGNAEISVPANAVLFTAGVVLQHTPTTRLGIAAGIGRYSAAGKATFQEDEVKVEEVSFAGTDTGQHYFAFFETVLAPGLRISARAGYRRAEIPDFEVKDDLAANRAAGDPPAELLYPFPGDGSSFDWSGFLGHIGFVHYFL